MLKRTTSQTATTNVAVSKKKKVSNETVTPPIQIKYSYHSNNFGVFILASTELGLLFLNFAKQNTDNENGNIKTSSYFQKPTKENTIKQQKNELYIKMEQWLEKNVKKVNVYRLKEDSNIECIQNAKDQLDLYFDRKREFDFKKINFDLNYGPPFYRAIWELMKDIPFGKTISYSQMAKMTGNEKAIRAAASAQKKNPIPIILPCHRVLDAPRKLLHYSAGGCAMKTLLLNHENENWRNEEFYLCNY